MARFSERIGAVSKSKTLQIESMDDELRNSLWNEVHARFDPPGSWDNAAQKLARLFYKVPVDSLPGSIYGDRDWVRNRFLKADWHEVYDLVEFFVDHVASIRNVSSTSQRMYAQVLRSEFENAVNQVLERELSGYRFISGYLAPITDPNEIAAIEQAGNTAASSSLGGAAIHIRTALELLGRKPSPDYRNSIKESISAVEAVVNSAASGNGGGIARAVDHLSQKVEIHSALRAALKQLYGFTSDADGIRHAILEQSTVGFAEAKFMLVACSAFCNFFVEKADQAGILN